MIVKFTLTFFFKSALKAAQEVDAKRFHTYISVPLKRDNSSIAFFHSNCLNCIVTGLSHAFLADYVEKIERFLVETHASAISNSYYLHYVAVVDAILNIDLRHTNMTTNEMS